MAFAQDFHQRELLRSLQNQVQNGRIRTTSKLIKELEKYGISSEALKPKIVLRVKSLYRQIAKHNDLMAIDGVYREAYETQLVIDQETELSREEH